MYDLAGIRAAVVAAASSFDASSLDRDAAADAVAVWTAVINAASAARAMAAAQVAECGAPSGARDAVSWFAAATGATAASARDALRCGAQLREQSATREAATAGVLSAQQAAAITDAVAVDPTAADQLVNQAGRDSLGELRDACQQVRAAVDPDPVATERRLHARRAVRRYRDGEGAEHLHMVGTRIELAKVDQALAPIIDGLLDQQHQREREPYEAIVFDAMIAAVTSGGPGRTDRAGRPKLRYLTLVRIDLEALTRGELAGGEVCEITGLGPIPVATARELLGESMLKLVVTKGVDVLHVTHLGRGVNTAQQIALLWQRPVCTRLGCGRRQRLENDHRIEWARVHCTQLANIEPLCSSDHDLKTRFGWALVEGTGKRPMVPPDHPDHPNSTRARSP
jgi:hypothetical protein